MIYIIAKRIKSGLLYLLSVVLSVIVIWYIMYHLFSGVDKKVETTPAVMSTVNTDIMLEAYIIRDETVLRANTAGGVNYLFSDGEKVGAGSVVANIYSGTGAAEVSDRILQIDKNIEVLENSAVANDSTLTDSGMIDKKIYELFYVMRDKIEDGDVEYALYKKDELLTYLNKRQLITQNNKSYEQQIIALKEERDRLVGQLIHLEENVSVAKSGYFYSSVDGYENIFDISKISDLTIDGYNALVNSDPAVYNGANVVGKIVNSNEWYIVSSVGKNERNKFTEGESYNIVFPYNSDVSVNMKLEKILRDNSSDSMVLVFKTDYMPDGFNYLRKQNIQIVDESYTGYKVPVNAVRVVDGVRGVYILSGNTVLFKEITVLTEQDGFFIVKEQPLYLDDEFYYKKLGLYDMIIVSGKDLYDGKIISNSGVGQ